MIQTIITQACGRCQSTNVVKNGRDYKGAQKYHCKDCGRYGTLGARRGYSAEVKAMVKQALLERVSLRGISRIFGIARPTLMAWLKGWVAALDELASTLVAAQAEDVLELDEVWSFVGSKAHPRWLWVALCRRTRQIVAYFIGDRSTTSCLQLWRQLPQTYARCRAFSDHYPPYAQIFDPRRLQSVDKESGLTSHVERWFNTLRQRLARFVRKTLSFSKSDTYHALFVRFFVHHYNLDCIS